jgi:hypothetical protein
MKHIITSQPIPKQRGAAFAASVVLFFFLSAAMCSLTTLVAV